MKRSELNLMVQGLLDKLDEPHQEYGGYDFGPIFVLEEEADHTLELMADDEFVSLNLTADVLARTISTTSRP